MRGGNPETHRNGNFERRLKETMDSELEPELLTPHSAGAEELDYEFPLVDQFKQTNMRPNRRGSRRGGKQDE